MSQTSRRLFVAAAGALALLAIASGARAQETPAPIPGPATTELQTITAQRTDAGFTREVEVDGDLFGVSWNGDPEATFAIETLETEGWTPAQEVGRMSDESQGDPGTPEAASAEGPYATEPLWSGDARAVRVTLASGTATDIELVAVTSGQLPDTSSTDLASLGLGGSALLVLGLAALGTGAAARLRRGAAVAIVLVLAVTGIVLAPDDDAQAGNAGRPSHLITRSQWGARKPQCDPGTFKKVRFAIVHHTAGGNDYGWLAGPSIVQGIQAYHMDLPGPDPYCDIAYNFLVDKYGFSYVGRAKSARVKNPIYGAHTSGHNKASTGVSVLGNYQVAPFTTEAKRAVADVLAWRFSKYDINPLGTALSQSNGGSSRWPAGTKVTVNTISGHRKFNPTECPGISIRKKLDAIRRQTDRKMN